MMLATIQCFPIGDECGGARILRALFEGSTGQAISVNTTDKASTFSPVIEEITLPLRPSLGRLERTRFAPLGTYLDRPSLPKFKRKLEALLRERQVTTVHTITHGATIGAVREVARTVGAKLIASFHDDVGYMSREHRNVDQLVAEEREMWLDADHRFVICEELGDEFCQRYGKREFETLTDGLAVVHSPRKPPKTNVLYFMGSLHFAYLPNVETIYKTLVKLNEQAPGSWRMLLRAGVMSLPFPTDPAVVTFLPFGTEADVESDMDGVSLLYLPLPFGVEHEDFVRLSLSTKMVTYLGAGLPILYHGPNYAAAGKLLEKYGAAVPIGSLEVAEALAALQKATANAEALALSAANLANSQFLLEAQREKFWRIAR